MVKPNFVLKDPGVSNQKRSYALYVGRLGKEKGTDTLLECWKKIDPVYQLMIAGDGPMKEEVEQFAQQHEKVTFLKQVPHDKVIELMRGAKFFIFPSMCYETFGLVLVEAFACGCPVIASNKGSANEIVQEGKTGLKFTPGQCEELVEKVNFMFNHPEKTEQMGCLCEGGIPSKIHW